MFDEDRRRRLDSEPHARARVADTPRPETFDCDATVERCHRYFFCQPKLGVRMQPKQTNECMDARFYFTKVLSED